MAVVDYYMNIQVGDDVTLRITRYKRTGAYDDTLIKYELYGSGYIYDDIGFRMVSTSIPDGEKDYFCKVTYSDNRELKPDNYADLIPNTDDQFAYLLYVKSRDFGFEELIIPDGIKNIPSGLFGNLSNLYRSIYVGKDVEQLGILDNDYYNYSRKYRDIYKKYSGYTNMQLNVFPKFAGENIIIAEENKILNKIGMQAFSNICSVVKTTYASYDFYKLTKIDFRGLPTFIDYEAFEGSDALTELNLGDLEYIYYRAFGHCTNLTKFNSENKINGIIYDGAFELCENLTMFTFTDNASFNYIMQGHFSVTTHKSNNIETTINTNNEIFLDYNWDNDGRIVKTSANTKVIYVAYNNKWIQLSVYKTGDIPVALDDVYCYLKLVELNDKNASPIKVNTPTGFKALSY
nr:MAG TPA: leucine-rich repeat protein [Caudoviricetes sp.]